MHPPIHHHASGGLFRRVPSVNYPIRGKTIHHSRSISELVLTMTKEEKFLCL